MHTLCTLACTNFVHLTINCWPGPTHQSHCTTWTSTSASEGRRTGPTSNILGSHTTSTMGWKWWGWQRWQWWSQLCSRCKYWDPEAEVKRISLHLTPRSQGTLFFWAFVQISTNFCKNWRSLLQRNECQLIFFVFWKKLQVKEYLQKKCNEEFQNEGRSMPFWTFSKITSILEVPYVPNLKVWSPVLLSEESEKIFDEVPHLHTEAMNICQR